MNKEFFIKKEELIKSTLIKTDNGYIRTYEPIKVDDNIKLLVRKEVTDNNVIKYKGMLMESYSGNIDQNVIVKVYSDYAST